MMVRRKVYLQNAQFNTKIHRKAFTNMFMKLMRKTFTIDKLIQNKQNSQNNLKLPTVHKILYQSRKELIAPTGS